jgi:hypothetical protein
MSDESRLISDAFQLFLKESPQHAQAWMTASPAQIPTLWTLFTVAFAVVVAVLVFPGKIAACWG